jgi:hypothetical protein
VQEWTFLFDSDEIKKSYLPFVERILVQGVSSSIGYVLRLHLARLQGQILHFLHLHELRDSKIDGYLFNFFKHCIEKENGGELEDSYVFDSSDSDFEAVIEERK